MTTDFRVALHEWMEVLMQHSMHGFLLYAKERGFSMSQLGALMHISKRGVSGITHIGDDLGVTNAAVSQMIDRLVHQGLIERSEDPSDRRAKLIELTSTGLQVVQECLEARQRWIDKLDISITGEERRVAIESLRLLTKKTRELENV